jgi:chromosome segregation ATPase
MARTLFGLDPREVNNEIQRIDTEYQAKVTALQVEIVQSREKLKEAEARVVELQRQLSNHMERERQIADVMVTAQINAQRIESQARAKAEILIQDTDEELHRKYQELELLRMKVKRFKEDIAVTLDRYRSSLDSINEPSDDSVFTPTLVTKERLSS